MSVSIQQYVQSAQTASVRTGIQYKSQLKFFSGYVLEKYKLSVDDLISNLKGQKADAYEVLSGYVLYLSKRGDKANLLRTKVITARNFLESSDVEIVPRRFKLKVRMPKQEQAHKEPLDIDTIREIINSVADIRLKTYLTFLGATGARATEALSLRMKDVDLNSIPARVQFQAKYTKTKVARVVFLTDELRQQIIRWIDYKYRTRVRVTYDRTAGKRRATARAKYTPKKAPEHLLFADGEGSEFNPNNMYTALIRSFEGALDRNGFGQRESESKRRKITLHSFRRFVKSTISNLGFQDFSEYQIGHRSSTYWRTSDKEKVEIFRKIEPYLTFLDFQKLEARGAAVESKLAEDRKTIQTLQSQMVKMEQNHKQEIDNIMRVLATLKPEIVREGLSGP